MTCSSCLNLETAARQGEDNAETDRAIRMTGRYRGHLPREGDDAVNALTLILDALRKNESSVSLRIPN